MVILVADHRGAGAVVAGADPVVEAGAVAPVEVADQVAGLRAEEAEVAVVESFPSFQRHQAQMARPKAKSSAHRQAVVAAQDVISSRATSRSV